ncbi:MAG: 3-oxoacyl-[acyl-carrier-protein] reductase [Bacteroidales bacterium]|jgi:3-oxoacyl-[acyl-carrier protein] reductase|nr:3-oxoacyl-[acyl-carrier-protein] reductase [Bacteroidales bacterium]
MSKLLEGKVAYITGGSRGIGQGIVEAFAEHGVAAIAFAGLETPEEVSNIIENLDNQGVRSRYFQYNVASLSETETAVKEAIDAFGRIDILVNNAGITRDTLLMRMGESDWDAVINVNLKSVFNHTKAVQPYMLKQRSGSIINTSSIVGITGNAGQTNYSASKAGIIGFTKSIAKEVGSRNIRCNAIAPGFIDTLMTEKLPAEIKQKWIEQIGLRRMGTIEDVARCAVFFASDLSAYVTGQVLVCDGGM